MRDVEEAMWFCPKCRATRQLLWALEAAPCGNEDCPLPIRPDDIRRPTDPPNEAA